MKKFRMILVVACIMCALTLLISAETLTGTRVRAGVADPWLFTDGEHYYLTMTGTSKIAVLQSDTISGFNDTTNLKVADNIVYDSAYDSTVTEIFGAGATLSGTWSPEIHYFSEEDYPGYSGWYMFLANRNNTGDSSEIQMVLLKSITGNPKGPYGHPITGEANRSQPILDKNGNIYSDWGCGMSAVRIPEGAHKGIYTLWVAEVGRGEGYGNFYQEIMIAKMSNPWTMSSSPVAITRPTQDWEKAGSSNTHPQVVEGATAVYGIHGEVYLIYSGSGYWSDYALGQLTWTGGNPLQAASWVKLSDTETGNFTETNPRFTAVEAPNVRGAGHASFITDKEGNGFFCYHAYPYIDGEKWTSRRAFIEPYYIDYTEWNGTSYGVVHLGIEDTGVPTISSTDITFALTGGDLFVPTVTATGGEAITLQMSAANADGYSIFRSTDGTTFTYLASVTGTTYTDSTVSAGRTYYYRVYSYREEEISAGSAVVSATTPALPLASVKPVFTGTQTATSITLTWETIADVHGYKIWRKAPGETAYTALKAIYDPNAVSYTDLELASGSRYCYLIRAFYEDENGVFHFSASSGGQAIYTTPTAPSGTVEYDYSGGIKITITTPVTCTHYVYCRSDNGGKSYAILAETADTSFVDNTVTVGSTYHYRVYAYAGDISVRSASTLAGEFTARPEAAVITMIRNTNDGVHFTWDAVANITGYKIWRKVSGTSSWTNFGLTNALTYTDTTAVEGTTYVYAVQTYKTVSGTNHYSSIPNVGRTITRQTPAALVGTVDYDYGGGIMVTVTSSVACDGYVYSRSEDGGNTYTVLARTSATSYLDENITVGTTYYYSVYAYTDDVVVCSLDSLIGSFTARPEAAVISSITTSGGSVTFTWGTVENIDGYKIWRKVNGTSSWTTLGKTTGLTYTDTTGTAGTTYVYAVQTYKNVGGTYYYSSIPGVGQTITVK